jgi:hypothetical protein
MAEELTEEAKAEIRAAIAIVRADKTGRVNEATIRKVFQEEAEKWKPPTPPPTPPVNDPPTPPTPPPPTPPTPPTPPVNDPPVKKKSRYWPEDD